MEPVEWVLLGMQIVAFALVIVAAGVFCHFRRHRRRLIADYVANTLGGKVSDIRQLEGLVGSVFEVVYLDRDQVKRKAKCVVTGATGVSWQDDQPLV